MIEVLKNGSRFALLVSRGRKWLQVIERTSSKLTVSKALPHQLEAEGWHPAGDQYPVARVVESFLNHAAGLTDTARRALTPEQEAPDVMTTHRNLTNPELLRVIEHHLQQSDQLLREIAKRGLAAGESEAGGIEDLQRTIATLRAEAQQQASALASNAAEIADLKNTINLLS